VQNQRLKKIVTSSESNLATIYQEILLQLRRIPCLPKALL